MLLTPLLLGHGPDCGQPLASPWLWPWPWPWPVSFLYLPFGQPRALLLDRGTQHYDMATPVLATARRFVGT